MSNGKELTKVDRGYKGQRFKQLNPEKNGPGKELGS